MVRKTCLEPLIVSRMEAKKTDAERRVKNWLQADAVDDVDEQAQAEEEGDSL